MALLSLRNVTLHYDGPALLDDVEFHIERGDRIALLGVNGAGKSSLLRVLAGEVVTDSGTVARAPGLRVAYLPQQVPVDLPGCVSDIVCPPGSGDDASREVEANRILHMFGLEPTATFGSLSGGTRRRVLLARALLGEPDIVLLDEPTNHLDLENIDELEGYLLRYCRTFLFITHDRAFLRRLAGRVVELDRGHIFDWRCDYDTFLRRKEESLDAEAKQWALEDKRLAQEEVWVRQGVRARRKRNEGRVRALMDMRAERQQRRERTGSVQMTIQQGERTGQVVLKAKQVTFGFGERPIIQGCTTTVGRGDRIGILGPNGCGKTTLLRLLLGPHAPEGALAPQAGTVVLGTNLQVSYADQLRGQLKENESLAENVAPGKEYVVLGENRRHILGYLQDFLFPPQRARLHVSALSGGERNRLLLARLFAQPSNVLVLDEPTNDLDLDTLELLEEQLDAYGGTVLLVSHDRAFLNNIATSILAFEKGRADGEGPWLGPDEGWYVNEYVGGYDDWLRQRVQPPVSVPAAASTPERGGKGKLTSKQKRELAELPARIEALETEQAGLHAQMADPVFYKKPGDEIARINKRADAIAAELDEAFHRWGELEAGKAG